MSFGGADCGESKGNGVEWDETPKSPGEADYGFVPKPAETKPTNPKDRAAVSRLDISLFPQSAIAYGALGMTEGDCKYGGYNYRVAGVKLSTYIAALNRHMFKFYNGEWADQTTGIPHLASMLSCTAIIIDGFVQGNINDDRPPKQDMATLLNEFEGIVKHLHKIFPNGPERNTEQHHDNAVNR